MKKKYIFYTQPGNETEVTEEQYREAWLVSPTYALLKEEKPDTTQEPRNFENGLLRGKIVQSK